MWKKVQAQVWAVIAASLLSICSIYAQYTGIAPYLAERGGLLINEVSNGTGGGEEYIELLVTGAPGAPTTPVDISGWILDDNNYPGSGQGNATGHLVFGDCYQAVPPGSIIVVYNAFDRNPKLPPDDPQDNNPADGVYIIPHTDNCLDACGSNPSSSSPNYCPCANPSAQPEGWQVGLRNEGDMVQIRDRCETLVHAVYWGGILVVPEVSGSPVKITDPNSQNGRVILFRHTVDNNWDDPDNFASLPSSSNESPGAANNPQNANFITALKTGAVPSTGQIPDCKDTDAGDIALPAEVESGGIPIRICYGTDLNAFGHDYSQPDEFAPDAAGFNFEYAYILTRNNPPNYDIETFNTSGDFDWSVLDPGSYLVWGFSYIQTNGSFGVEAFLNTVNTITQIRNYSACGFDADLDNLSPGGIPMEVQILPGNGFIESTALEVCDPGNGQFTFNLVAVEPDIVNGPVTGISWYLDAQGTTPVPNPAAFSTGTTVVYAQPGSGACSPDPVPIYLNIVTPPKPQPDVDQEIACKGDLNGAVSLSITGGKAPFSVQWSNGSTAEQLQNLAAGTYSVTVTDAIGCNGTASVTLNDPPAIDLICSAVAPVSTLGGSEGKAQFELAGGSPPYVVDVSGPVPSNFDFSGGHELLTGLTAGQYTITATDDLGCSIACQFEIGYPDCPFLLEFEVRDISCFGTGDGAVGLNIYGGKPPYVFQWSNGALTKDLSGLEKGPYDVTVTDAAGCAVSGNASIAEPAEIVAEIDGTDPVCFGAADGAITVLSVSGGTGPFSLLLNGTDIGQIPNLPFTAGGLAPGNYPVKIRDAKGCEADYNLELTEPAPLTLDLGPNQFIEQGEIVYLQPVTNFQVASFTWSPEDYFPNPDFQVRFQPRESVTLSLEAFDFHGCAISDEVLIGVARRPVPVFIPNAFSPDLDGINDRFTVYSNEDLLEVRSLQIFDRWGGLVFSREHFPANDEGQGWDGKAGGKPATAGVYVYLLEVTEYDGKVVRMTGNVVLVR